jgi:hypothetical protein
MTEVDIYHPFIIWLANIPMAYMAYMAYSLATSGTSIGGTYHIKGLCKASVRGYAPRIWPKIWY